MKSYKLIGKAGLFSLVVAIFSMQFTGTVEAAWESTQLQQFTENCVKSAEDQFKKQTQKLSSRKNLSLGPNFSTEVQRLSGKIQSTCQCLTNKVSVKWPTLDVLLQESPSMLDAFVNLQFQTGKCRLPDFTK